jgi:hypothetical protein
MYLVLTLMPQLTLICQSFLLDVLDSLPRLRMSSSMLQMVLWLLKKCHIPNVPSLWQFRKMQEQMREMHKAKPVRVKSAFGTAFSVNDPRQSIAQVSALTS